jgi:hypothetical protein
MEHVRKEFGMKRQLRRDSRSVFSLIANRVTSSRMLRELECALSKARGLRNGAQTVDHNASSERNKRLLPGKSVCALVALSACLHGMNETAVGMCSDRKLVAMTTLVKIECTKTPTLIFSARAML